MVKFNMPGGLECGTPGPCYTMDETSGGVDDSYACLNLSLVGTVGSAGGNIGNARKFTDNGNKQVDLSVAHGFFEDEHNKLYSLNNRQRGMGFSFWIYHEWAADPSGYLTSAIVSKGCFQVGSSPPCNDHEYTVSWENPGLGGSTKKSVRPIVGLTNGGNAIGLQLGITTGVWTFVTVGWNDEGTLHFYEYATEVGQTAPQLSLTTSIGGISSFRCAVKDYKFRIGCKNNADITGSPTYHDLGYDNNNFVLLDNVKLHRCPRSSGEWEQLHIDLFNGGAGIACADASDIRT